MALFYSNEFWLRELETQEQVQARIDKMNAQQFNACVTAFLFQSASGMLLAFYAPPCGLPTHNAMTMLALARRLARENSVDTAFDERMYADAANHKVIEAEEGMLLEQD